MIPNGSVLNYSGRWPKPAFSLDTISQLTDMVTQNLPSNGLIVRDAHGQIDSIASTSYLVQLTIQVQNGVGFDKADDVISIIRHWVYQVLGDYPLADSIPVVTAPGGAGQGTGQPGPTPQGGEKSGTDCSGISGFFSCLTQKTLLYLAIIGIGAGLGVILILNAPTVAAKAARGRRK